MGNLPHLIKDLKINVYDAPDAVELVNEQIKKVSEEKQENCLLSHFAIIKD